jgi:hypothetical protein
MSAPHDAKTSLRRCALATALSLASCASADHASVGWESVADLEGSGWIVSTTASTDGQTWFAIGGTPERGVLLRERAAQWIPEAIPDVPLLTWAHVFDDGRVFVVGNAGTALYFDGQSWAKQATPTLQDLWGVWGAHADDVWAVGGAGASEGQATLLHYDGDRWAAGTLPELERPDVWALFKVWGSSASDVYVVGQRGAMLHYDGQAWSELGIGTGEDLVAIFGIGPNRIAAVGGRDNGFVATFDGTRWNGKTLVPLPGLNGVWLGEPDTIYVGGIAGTLAEVDFNTLEHKDQRWPTNLTFHALHGSAQRVLAVGGNLGVSEPPYRGIARELIRGSP